MLIVLMPLLATLAAPSPVPSPSAPPAPPSPLKEIGHVESLSVCSTIVVHANGAINAALDNDQTLALTINRLRTTDLDSESDLKRRNGMSDLWTLAGRIRMSAMAGTAEIKRLRTMAAQTTQPGRKAELSAFADALGGALARQRKAGQDLDHLLAIIDGRRAVEQVNTQDLVEARDAIAGPAGGAMSTGNPGEPADPAVMRNIAAPAGPVHVNDILRTTADDFQARSQDILSDEGVAADHSLGATTGC